MKQIAWKATLKESTRVAKVNASTEVRKTTQKKMLKKKRWRQYAEGKHVSGKGKRFHWDKGKKHEIKCSKKKRRRQYAEGKQVSGKGKRFNWGKEKKTQKRLKIKDADNNRWRKVREW